MKEAKLNHENHVINEQVYDHYPENVRLKESELTVAQQMNDVGGNKKLIKMYLQKQRGKPVLMKTLHNIQTKSNEQKKGGPENMLETIYNAMKTIPAAIVRVICNQDDEFIGK